MENSYKFILISFCFNHLDFFNSMFFNQNLQHEFRDQTKKSGN
jgi:hypothetical protein